jgi:hypothetical protein
MYPDDWDSLAARKVIESLKPSELEILEAESWLNNNNGYQHSLLISYYFRSSQFTKRLNHILWLIKNEPQNSILFWPECVYTLKADEDLLIDAWELALKSSSLDPHVLRNAASFFAAFNIRKSLDLLIQARTLDSAANLDAELIHYASLMARNSCNNEDIATLKDLCEALLVTHISNVSLLETLIMVSLKERDLLKVKMYSKRLTETGCSTHLAHEALGLVSLIEGDKNEAKTQLLLAGQVANLTQYYFDFTLAYHLMKIGERIAVCKYLIGLWKKKTEWRPFLSIWVILISLGLKPPLSLSLEKALGLTPLKVICD